MGSRGTLLRWCRSGIRWLPEVAKYLGIAQFRKRRPTTTRLTAALEDFTPSDDDDEPNTDYPTNTAKMSTHTHGYETKRRTEMLLGGMEANGLV